MSLVRKTFPLIVVGLLAGCADKGLAVFDDDDASSSQNTTSQTEHNQGTDDGQVVFETATDAVDNQAPDDAGSDSNGTTTGDAGPSDDASNASDTAGSDDPEVVEDPCPEGQVCDDEDPCTVGDHCQGGTCAGQAIACDDQNQCTEGTCKIGECFYEPLESDECRLWVTITSPQRAAVITESSTVIVQGMVTSPASDVVTVVMNEQAVVLQEDGTFTTSMEASFGINVIDVSAENGMEQTSRVAQSFLYAETFHPVGTPDSLNVLSDSIGAWISPGVFDDNDTATVDDMATMVGLVLEGFDINSAIPDPLFPEDEKPGSLGCYYDVTVSNVTLYIDPNAPEAITIVPIDGGLQLAIEFTAQSEDPDTGEPIVLSADFDAVADGWVVDFCPDAKAATATIDSVSAQATLLVAVEDGKIVLSAETVNVTMGDVKLSIESGFAQYFNWLVNFFEDDLANIISEKIEELLPEKVIPLINDVLNDFSTFEYTLELPAIMDWGEPLPLTVALSVGDVLFSDSGAEMTLGFGSAVQAAFTTEMPGSFSYDGCTENLVEGASLLSHTSDIEAYVVEDIANQVLHNLWLGGYTNLTVMSDSLNESLATFGITEAQLDLSLELPPVVTSCTESGNMEFQVGDVFIDADFRIGDNPAEMQLYATLNVAVTLGVVENPEGANQVEVADIQPGPVVMEVVSSSGMGTFDDDTLEFLFASAASDLLASDILTSAIQAISIPVVDLGGYIPGLSQGTELTFSPNTLSVGDGHLVVGGNIVSL